MTGERRIAWLRPALRLSAVLVGGVHAWVAARQLSMNEDGISYLDMGDACVRGDWDMALNAVWSPAYACLLGAVRYVVDPGMETEFVLVHALNLVIFLFALFCFEWFWFRAAAPLRAGAPEGERDAGASGDGPPAASGIGLPDWAWALAGYALFAWVSLVLIRIWAVTPDMLMAGFLFLAAGLWLRCAGDGAGRRTALALGAVLGLAFLTKAVMFPLALVFIGLLLLTGGLRRTAPMAGLAFLAFAITTGPWVTALSLDKDRLTFGDAGRLTYLRYVNGAPYPHWRAEAAPGLTAPEHPTRRIFREPEIFEFASPVGGTYPPGYDPSYWYADLAPRLDLTRQTAALARNLVFYFDLFVLRQGGALAVVLLLLAVGASPTGSGGGRIRLRRWLDRAGRLRGPPARRWGLALTAAAAFVAYAAVYVEGRYVGAFLVLLWACLLGAVRLPPSRHSRRLLAAGTIVLVLFFGLQLAAFHAEGASRVANLPSAGPAVSALGQLSGHGGGDRPLRVARAAREAGLEAGDHIAFVGYAFGAYFARLAKLRIVAEVPWDQMDAFWALDGDRRLEAMAALRRTGATAVVAETGPGEMVPPGWRRLGETAHLVYRLR